MSAIETDLNLKFFCFVNNFSLTTEEVQGQYNEFLYTFFAGRGESNSEPHTWHAGTVLLSYILALRVLLT